MTDKTMTLDYYDAGLLGEGGGGEISWWHDYIRSELYRAHEFYQGQANAITRHLSQPAERGEAVALPVPSSIDTSHKNQAFVTLGFGDQSQRDSFVKATRSHRTALYTAPPPAAGVLDENEASVAAIQFALTAEDGFAWLRLWNEGDFEACRREWPEAPSQCYVGADPLLSTTPSPTIDVAAVREVIGELNCTLHQSLQGAADFCGEQANKLARAIGDAK